MSGGVTMVQRSAQTPVIQGGRALKFEFYFGHKFFDISGTRPCKCGACLSHLVLASDVALMSHDRQASQKH